MFTTSYIISQILLVIGYGFFAATYLCKTRRAMLILNFGCLSFFIAGYFFLGAFTGAVVNIVAFVRTIIFCIQDKTGKPAKNSKGDITILVCLIVAAAGLTALTFNTFVSLFALCSSVLYTYSMWQRSTLVYKMIGIPINMLAVLYSLGVGSIVGAVCDFVILCFSFAGFLLDGEQKNVKFKKNQKGSD